MTMRDSIPTIKRLAAAGMLAVAVAAAAVLGTVAPHPAYAAVSKVQTATATPTYENPATGQVEDSGGEANRELGTSMVSSTVDTHALVETDTAGKTFITVRVHLADQISNVQVETSTDGGNTFAAATATQTKSDLTHGDSSPDNTSDWRFEAPSANVVIRLKLDVAAMGRQVTCFVSFSNPQDGNTVGFAAQVTPGEGSDDAADETSGESSDSADTADGGKDASGDAADAADDANDQTGGSGVSEYNADGQKVDGDTAQPLSGTTVAAIVGVAVVAAVVVGAVVYVAVIRPRRARESAAAAAAADDAAVQAGGTDAADTPGAATAETATAATTDTADTERKDA